VSFHPVQPGAICATASSNNACSSPVSIYCGIALLFKHFGVIHAMTAQSVAPRRTIMTTFTIDAENSITAFPTPDQAAAAVGAGAQSFTSQQELAELIAGWPAERALACWNALPGVTPAKKLKDSKTAASRIWERIQGLGAPEPQTEQPAKPKAERKAKGGAKVAKGEPAKGKATKKATPAKNAPKAKKAAKAKETAGPREGSKTAQVVAMLQRKNGATLEEIMEKMGWQKHTVRGFMAGAMRKAGYSVESYKSDKGERTYRINE
jgi:hypothetical protein